MERILSGRLLSKTWSQLLWETRMQGAESDGGRRFAVSGPEGNDSRSLLRFDLRPALTGRRPDSVPRTPSRCHAERSLYRGKQGGRGHRCDRVQFIYSRLSCREGETGERWNQLMEGKGWRKEERAGTSGTLRWWHCDGNSGGGTGFIRTSRSQRLLLADTFASVWARVRWPKCRGEFLHVSRSCLDWRRVRLRKKSRSNGIRLFSWTGVWTFGVGIRLELLQAVKLCEHNFNAQCSVKLNQSPI